MQYIEDQVYIDRIKAGDSKAYAYLVDKYKDMAYTIALKITGDRQEAQDVAQEGFLKAYQQIKSFEGRSKYSTWLYTIIYRTAINHWKKHKGRHISLSDQLDEKYTTDASTLAPEGMEARQREQYVKEAIDKLPKMDALLITLYYLDENTVKEIGEITGLSWANIKIKLFRARKKLERELSLLL